MGMALRQAEVASAVIGHDKDAGASKAAKKLGAVDRTDWNLISACEESQLIILAIPIDGIKHTLEALAPYLQPGCVIVDTASLKQPVMALADEILPDKVYFVGMNPIIGDVGEGGTDAARADLFHKRLFCMTPSPKAEPDVVKLVSDLITILGGKPLFMDPVEHDGLMGAVDQLPSLLALTLLETVVNQPSWRELRKVAGGAFEAGSQLVSEDPMALSESFLSNRDNVLRWIDGFSASLASVRQALTEDDAEQLTERFDVLIRSRRKWLLDRAEGQWETAGTVEMPERPNLLVDTFLGGLWRKRKKPDE
jgi:prephenate dehydrogenase